MSAFDQAVFAKKPKIFTMPNRGPQHQNVQICGSFDNWEERHNMHFDPITVQWYVTLHLKIGEEYLYKYIINDNNWVVNEEEPVRMDDQGNKNNFCGIFN